MKPSIILIILISTVVFFAGVFLYGKGKEEKEEVFSVSGVATLSDSVRSEAPGQADRPDTEAAEGFVSAYICGEVKKPGVYRLEEGCRINDLLIMAGGFAEDALVTAVNLAARLNDGDMIYIPSVSEKENEYRADVTNAVAGLVNINTADLKMLMSLPGIGETRAQAIIDYRNRNGFFGEVDDIMKVSGIGKSIFSELRPFITV